MVLRLMSYSPRRSGFCVTVAPEKLATQELDASVEASGPHDFAVRQPHRPSSAPPASTASRSAFRDVAQRPSEERDGDRYKVIWVFGKSEYFFKWGWTDFWVICPSGRPGGASWPGWSEVQDWSSRPSAARAGTHNRQCRCCAGLWPHLTRPQNPVVMGPRFRGDDEWRNYSAAVGL